MQTSPEIENLITHLARLPGFGPRSARRVALALLRHPQTRMLPLSQALAVAAEKVKTCSVCGNLDTQDPCSICTDSHRDTHLLCVVEQVGDLWALERAGVHRGLYHVLGGSLSPLSGTGPEDLNVASLLRRVERGHIQEIILALGATVDGVTTMHWLQEKLSAFDVTTSKLGQGVPMGGALEVLDDGTLAAALAARRPL